VLMIPICLRLKRNVISRQTPQWMFGNSASFMFFGKRHLKIFSFFFWALNHQCPKPNCGYGVHSLAYLAYSIPPCVGVLLCAPCKFAGTSSITCVISILSFHKTDTDWTIRKSHTNCPIRMTLTDWAYGLGIRKSHTDWSNPYEAYRLGLRIGQSVSLI